MADPLDEVLGTRAKVRLLRVLVGADHLSGREVSERAGIGPGGGSKPLRELTDTGILTRIEGGGAHLHSLNRDHPLAEPLRRLFLAESNLPTTGR